MHLSQCRTKKTSFRLVSRTEFSSTGATRISGSHSRLIQVVRPQLEGKQRTPLSSRVATCISWRLLSGLKGDRPPVEFGEWTRDCSLGHVGKEGPHLTMTGASHVFSRAEVPVWGFHEVGWGAQGASRVVPGKSGLHARGEGERVIALASWQGTRASRCVRNLEVLSSRGRKPRVPSTSACDLRELLRLPLRSQGYCGVWRGLSGLHWVWYNGREPHLEWRQEPQCSSPFLTTIAGPFQS